MKRLRAFLIGFTLFAANIVAQFQSDPIQNQNFDKYKITNQAVYSQQKQLACVDLKDECR